MPKVIILGSSNAVPSINHENTHLVIRGKERTILVDCVSNPIVRLEQAGIDFNDLTDIVITHFHPDHVTPRHMGGQHIWTNVVAACPHCNHRKGGRKVEEVHMKLLRIPKEPPASAVYIFGRHLNDYQEWEPYINGW